MALPAVDSRVVGVAVVGTGKIAREWHLPEWSKRGDARVLWTVDVDADAARDAATTWGAESWTTDLRKVLEDPAVDVVDLCTPVEVHDEQTRAALSEGKHLLVEKPAAGSITEVQAMADAADAAGVVAMVAENWLFCAGMTRARRLIATGELGEPLSVAVTRETGAALGRPPAQEHSLLLNSGVHAVNMVRHLMGEPTHVSAFARPDRASALSGPSADTDLVVSLRFAGERLGSLQLSANAQRVRPGVRQVRVLGTDGLVEFDVFQGWVEWTDRAWSDGRPQRWRDDTAGSRGYAEELDHLLAAVRGEVDALPTLHDQVRTHLVMDAIWESARDLSTVEVASP